MNLLIRCCPDKFVLCLAANVLVQIAVVTALAWLLASAVARHRPARRHGIWLSALLCILFSPAASYVAVSAGLSLITLPWLPPPASIAVEQQPPPPPVTDIEPALLMARNMVVPRGPVERPDLAPMRPVRNGVIPADQEAAPVVSTTLAAPPTAGDAPRALLGLVTSLWMAGTLLCLARLLRGWSRVVRLQRWVQPASDPRLQAVLTEIRHDLNVAALPRLAILPRGSELRGPATLGVFRPLVILPENLIEALDARGLRSVLLHEFAHALRRDPLVGLLQRLVAAVFWPYPPVYLVNWRLAAAREEVCDNYVLRRGDAADYAETLLTIYESFRGVRLHPSALGICHHCGKLEQRVAEMLNPRRNVMVRMHRVAMAGTAALFMTAVVLVAGTRLVEAESKTPPAAPAPAAAAAGDKEAAGEQDVKKGGGSQLVTSHGEQGETVTGVRPQGTCSLAGKVIDKATGKPVPHARMYLFYSPTYAASFVNTDSDGTFIFKNIPSGPYTLKTSHVAGYQDWHYDPEAKGGQLPKFSLKEGEQRGGIVIEVKQACRISGTVFDEDGKLPHDASELGVYAWVKADDGKEYRVEEAMINRSDCSYVIDGLSDKPVYVMALVRRAARGVDTWPPIYYPSTFSRSQAKLVTFEKARSVANVNITRRRGGGLVIAGIVRDPSGKPIPEALVAIHHRDMRFDQATAYSDTEGRYEIRGLGEGEFLMHVDAAHRGFVRARLPLTLDGRKPRTEQNFTLTQGASISGKLVDRKGNAWEIAASDGQANVVTNDTSGHSTFTGLRNEYGANDTRRFGPCFFQDGKGPYDKEQMRFPTASTFLIQGVLPGHTSITFTPQKEGQKVAEIRYAGRDILKAGLDTKPGQALKDVTIVIESKASAAAEKKPAAATGKQESAPAKVQDSGSDASVSPPTAKAEGKTSLLDKLLRAVGLVPEGERFHLVRSAHTWIGNDGEPLEYDDYDEQFYMNRGAHIVVLSRPGEGFFNFYKARTLDPETSQMDVSEEQPASEPLANIVLPGEIDLPAYQLLWQPSVQQALHLAPQQRTALQDLSAKYWPTRRQIAGKELTDTESAAHKELQERAAKAHGGLVQSNHFGDELPFSREVIVKLERQWNDARRQIEAVLTPEQLRTLKDLTFRTFAFGSGVMFESGVLQRLDVPQEQQDQLRTLERQLQKEKEGRLRDMTREKVQKMLAVLTAQQRAQLREQYGPDKHPETDCSMFPYPMLPSFMPDSGAAEGLGFTPEQCQRVRAIVTAHWGSLIGLQAAEQKLRVDDEKGFKAIGEKRRQEMLNLRKQVEAALTPEQWAKCKEIAFENQAVTILHAFLNIKNAPDVLTLTEQQHAALRAVEAEYFDKPQQIYCEMTDKALAAFTPAQQEQLRAEVDRRGW